jgi:hypothetical protein
MARGTEFPRRKNSIRGIGHISPTRLGNTCPAMPGVQMQPLERNGTVTAFYSARWAQFGWFGRCDKKDFLLLSLAAA